MRAADAAGWLAAFGAEDVAVTVKKGQKVTGGKTIIGRMKD